MQYFCLPLYQILRNPDFRRKSSQNLIILDVILGVNEDNAFSNCLKHTYISIWIISPHMLIQSMKSGNLIFEQVPQLHLYFLPQQAMLLLGTKLQFPHQNILHSLIDAHQHIRLNYIIFFFPDIKQQQNIKPFEPVFLRLHRNLWPSCAIEF